MTADPLAVIRNLLRSDGYLDDPDFAYLPAALDALEERLEQAEAALREIRWLHHDDGADYRQLFAEAQRIAAASIPKEET